MNAKKFSGKLYRKLFDLSTKFIPYNRAYRPDGFYWTVNDENSLVASEKATYVEVFPKSAPGIDTEDPFYNLCTAGLKPQPVASIPAAFLLEIPNGRLQQNMLGIDISVISQNNKLIGEVSYQYERSNVSASVYEHAVFKQRFFPAPAKYKGVVFSLLSGDVASSNIFHWLYDALPRLYILKESGLFNQVDYFLMPRLRQPYHKQSLQLLGIDETKIIECSNYVHVTAERLMVTSPVRHKGITPTWVCENHYKYYAGHNATEASYAPLIYIRRGDSKIRQIVNEGELIAMLEQKGFKPYLLSKLSFSEQIRLFSQAKVIVSAHGAGLANLSFCQPGTALIELFAPSYIKPTYQIVSKKVGIDYTYLICKAASAKKPGSLREAINQNIKADLQEITHQLNELANKTSKPLENYNCLLLKRISTL